jgi:hypothetical protein
MTGTAQAVRSENRRDEFLVGSVFWYSAEGSTTAPFRDIKREAVEEILC